ncbi:hypothetical protein OV450_3509 [Actinobacteria bacterium OV450]|nr:hypothetical protein OV450_3509 [Actinobacteria bacterium OV450]
MMPPNLRRHTYTTPSGSLAAVHCAPSEGADRGSCVVLVGGLYGSKEDFLPLMPQLATAGHHTYAYDHRGQYESDGPTDPGDYSLDHLAADLQAVLSQVAHPRAVHLVGLCMGAYVARAAALATTSVLSLTAVGWHLGRDGALARRLRTAAALGRRLGPNRTVRLVTGIADLARPDEAPDPAYQAVARARLTTTRGAHYLGLTRAWAAALESDGHPKPLTPTLLVRGSQDTLFPAQGFTDAASRLGAELTVVPEAGHLVQLHRPRAVAQSLLRFWTTRG